jgi:hypothetical protein
MGGQAFDAKRGRDPRVGLRVNEFQQMLENPLLLGKVSTANMGSEWIREAAFSDTGKSPVLHPGCLNAFCRWKGMGSSISVPIPASTY